MNFEKEFEGNIKQLMKLLKKMMAQYPQLEKNKEIVKFLENPKNLPDVNIFFLNLSPLNPEELDEFEEIFEEGLFAESFKSGELKYEINREDEEFLKRNGIRF